MMRFWQLLPDEEELKVGEETAEGGWYVSIVDNCKHDVYEYKDGQATQLVGHYDSIVEAISIGRNLK